jgi:lysophospholipase L1-like esterase
MFNMQSASYRLRLKEDLRIVGLGDSAVYGVGDMSDEAANIGLGWTGRLAHDLNAKKYLNLSKNGARAKDVWNHQLAPALAAKPDLVLICVGGNDALRNNFKPSDVANYLDLSIKKLQAAGAIVVLLGLHDPSHIAPAPKIIKQVLLSRIMKVNKALEWVSKENQSVLIKTINLKEIYERKFWHIDRMHPSPFGHQYLADLVRRNLSLPRRKKSKIPYLIEVNKKAKSIWLLTNGIKWFLRRSIDLLPALIYLVVIESFKSRSLGAQYREHLAFYLENILKITIENSKKLYFDGLSKNSEIDQELVELEYVIFNESKESTAV